MKHSQAGGVVSSGHLAADKMNLPGVQIANPIEPNFYVLPVGLATSRIAMTGRTLKRKNELPSGS